MRMLIMLMQVLNVATELYRTGAEYKDLEVPPFDIPIPDRPDEEGFVVYDAFHRGTAAVTDENIMKTPSSRR